MDYSSISKRKKILIYWAKNQIKPIGGPSGYLCSISDHLNDLTSKYPLSIDFLPDTAALSHSKMSRYIPKAILNIRNVKKDESFFLNLISAKPHESAICLNRFDAVHFHSVLSMYSARDSLENFHGRVFLTSHSPYPLHIELISEFRNREERNFYKKHYADVEKIDEWCFGRADTLIFPCPSAEDAYYSSWPQYSSLCHSTPGKTAYVLTGTEKKSVVPAIVSSFRDEHHIPKEAFVVCFVGRHSAEKGYDVLKEIAEQVLSVSKNIYFVCVGNPGSIKPLRSNRWIEAGWSSSPMSIVACSDLFILPNKATYFDLAALEALSIGSLLLLSNTGGNRVLIADATKGIFSYSTVFEAAKLIVSLSNIPEAIRKEYSAQNFALFENKYSDRIFFDNYLTLLASLLLKS